MFLDNTSYLVEAMQFGRNIIFNIRRFSVYQTTIAINLALFIGIGQMRFLETPISPSIILWLNFVMDTMAGIIFGTELPDKNKDRIDEQPESDEDKKNWVQYHSVLDISEPNSLRD